MHATSKLFLGMMLIFTISRASADEKTAARTAAPSVTAPEDSPREFFRRELAKIPRHQKTAEAVPVNLPVIDKAFEEGRPRMLVEGDPIAEVVDLKVWSRKDRGAGDLPLFWNASNRRWEIPRRQASEATLAQLKYTWLFLQAYSALDPQLRRSGSTLAIGVAGLVSAEAVYRENWAWVPADLVEPMAMVQMIALYAEPELLTECFLATGKRTPLLRQAINKMCATQNEGKAQERMAVRATHQQLDWLFDVPYSTAINGKHAQLEDLLPSHAGSLEDLLQRANSRVHNLTLRATIIASICPELYGIPAFRAEAAAEWQKHLDALLVAARRELALRPEVTRLAPRFSADVTETLKADAGLLRPLMQMATQIAAKSLPQAKDNVTAEGYLAALRSHPATLAVLKLAGTEPTVEILASSTSSIAQQSRPGRIIWDRLFRTDPRGSGNGQPGADSQELRAEQVELDLVDFVPLGQGHPINGVDTGTLMKVRVELPDKSRVEKWLPAGEVTVGMDVWGVPFLGAARSTAPVELTAKHRPMWFRVVARELHENVPLTIAVGLTDPLKPGAVHEIVAGFDSPWVQAFDKQHIVWRPASHIDPGSRLGLPGATCQVVYAKRLHQPRSLIEFSLVSDERSHFPNNFTVRPASAPESYAVLAEGRPSTAGPIDAHAVAALAAGGVVPVGEIVTNPDVMSPRPDASILRVCERKLEGDPWPNPPLTEHSTIALKTTRQPVLEAYYVTFVDGSTLLLAPGNWLMELANGRVREVAVDTEHLKKGMKIVSGVDDQGQITTLEVKHEVTRKETTGLPFVLVELCNCSWLRVGPVLVSVDFRPWHETMEGLMGGTQVAYADPEGADGGAAADPEQSRKDTKRRVSDRTRRLPDAMPVLSREQMHALQSQSAGEVIAMLDGTNNSIEAGPLEKIAPSISTRFIRVRTKRGDKTRELSCGPGQDLLVQRAGELGYYAAADLKPGDQVLVAELGSESATPWPVTGMQTFFRPQFSIFELVAAQRAFYGENMAASANVGLAEYLAVGLTIPANLPEQDPRERIPAIDGRGPGTGRTDGQIAGESRVPGVVPQPRFARPPQHLLDDKILLPGNARTVLVQRGAQLRALFGQQRGQLPQQHADVPDTATLRFWRRVLTEAVKGSTAGSEPALASPLDAVRPDIELERWFTELLRRRELFLTKQTNSAHLSHVLALEIAAASWFWQLGAKELSDLLVLDVTELAIYTAVEFRQAERLVSRLGKDLELPVLIRVRNFVRAEAHAADSLEKVSLNQTALSAADAWARDIGFGNAVSSENGQLALRQLLTYWQDRVGGDPDWADIGQPSGTGALSGEIGVRFETWIRDALRRVVSEEADLDRALQQQKQPAENLNRRPQRLEQDVFQLKDLTPTAPAK